MGRPAASALHDFVTAAAEAYLAGHSLDRLTLQLSVGGSRAAEFRMSSAGSRLTGSEMRYRAQWLEAIYVTLQRMGVAGGEASGAAARQADTWLLSIVHRVLEGQRTGEEQSFVKFDRALATGGASGGAAAERAVIAPQWVPVSQLVLLTMKVVNELREKNEL